MGPREVITFKHMQTFLVLRNKNTTDENDHFQALNMLELKPELLNTLKSN